MEKRKTRKIALPGSAGYVIFFYFFFIFRSWAPGFLQLPVKSHASQFKIISDW